MHRLGGELDPLPGQRRRDPGDLERARPRVVIRWLSPLADQPEDNGAGRSSGVRLLDRYLEEAYRPDRRFGLELRDISDDVRDSQFKVFQSVIDSGGVVLAMPGGGPFLTSGGSASRTAR